MLRKSGGLANVQSSQSLRVVRSYLAKWYRFKRSLNAQLNVKMIMNSELGSVIVCVKVLS
jgi:hypothetical protein